MLHQRHRREVLKPNESNLFAVIECEFEGPLGCPVLAELIVTSNGEDKHMSYEQVSIAPSNSVERDRPQAALVNSLRGLTAAAATHVKR